VTTVHYAQSSECHEENKQQQSSLQTLTPIGRAQATSTVEAIKNLPQLPPIVASTMPRATET